MLEYQEAVKRDDKRADAFYHMGTVCAQLGRFDEATANFQKALTLTPGDANLFCDMGYCLLLQGRLDEARMNLRQAVVLEPNHERAHNNLGLALAHAGQRAEALAEFAKAGCDESDARCNLAFVMTLQGQRAAAKHEYRQALALNPASETAKKGLHELDAMAGQDKPATQQPEVLPATYVK